MDLTLWGKECGNPRTGALPPRKFTPLRLFVASLLGFSLAQGRKRISFRYVDPAPSFTKGVFPESNRGTRFRANHADADSMFTTLGKCWKYWKMLEVMERTMKQAIWISYDFGVRGDYEGMYAWLDAHGALECGDSLALVHYEFSGELIPAIQRDIQTAVEVTRKTRIYVILRDSANGKMKGRFIFGTRKAAPWTGYAVEQEEVLEDVEI